MPDPASIERLRLARNGARTRFDAMIEQVKSDFSARGVGARITDTLTEDARETAAYALDIARENKGVIAGTLAAIALWFLRNPIIAWIERHFGDDELPEAGDDNFGE